MALDAEPAPNVPESGVARSHAVAKPRSAYMIFAASVREELKSAANSDNASPAKPAMSAPEVARLTADRWRALPDAERAALGERAAAEKAAWTAWVQQHGQPESAALERAAAGAAGSDAWLPLSRVKRIAKADPAVATVSKDALTLLATATELFIQALLQDAGDVARVHKRKGISEPDVYHAVHESDMWEFLHRDFPLSALAAKQSAKARAEPEGEASKGSGEAEAAADAENADAAVRTPPKEATGVFGMLQRALATGALRPRVENTEQAASDPEPSLRAAVAPTAAPAGKAAKALRPVASLGKFFKVISADEARAQAEASLAQIHVGAPSRAMAGKKRRSGEINLAEDEDDIEEVPERRDDDENTAADDSTNLAAIRARIMGKPSKTTKRKSRPQSRRARLAAAIDEDEREAAAALADTDDLELGQE